MSNQEEMQKFKIMSKEELTKIARSKKSTELDMIMASIELGHRNIAEGNVYTTEEVREHIFGANYLASRC